MRRRAALAASAIGTSRKPSAVASWTKTFADVVSLRSSRRGRRRGRPRRRSRSRRHVVAGRASSRPGRVRGAARRLRAARIVQTSPPGSATQRLPACRPRAPQNSSIVVRASAPRGRAGRGQNAQTVAESPVVAGQHVDVARQPAPRWVSTAIVVAFVRSRRSRSSLRATSAILETDRRTSPFADQLHDHVVRRDRSRRPVSRPRRERSASTVPGSKLGASAGRQLPSTRSRPGFGASRRRALEHRRRSHLRPSPRRRRRPVRASRRPRPWESSKLADRRPRQIPLPAVAEDHALSFSWSA